MRTDITEGGLFPDDELPDHDGVSRRLSELQGANPMVLHLVTSVEGNAIRYTEGTEVGVKR